MNGNYYLDQSCMEHGNFVPFSGKFDSKGLAELPEELLAHSTNPNHSLEGYEWIKDEAGGGSGEEVQFVDDEQMLQLPHRHTGVVLAVHKCGVFQLGTGILISRNLVLTCAHVIHSKSYQNKPFPDIYFYPRQHGKLTHFIEVEGTATPEEYTSKQKWLNKKIYDYTLLKLKDNVNETGFLPLSGDLPQLDKKTTLSIYGYPESKYDRKDKKLVGVKQYGLTRTGHILDVYPEEGYMVHRISTQAGQSGSAVIKVENNGNMLIVGIHVGTPEQETNKYSFDFPELKKVNLAKLTNKLMIERLTMFANNLDGEMFRVVSSENKSTHQMIEEQKKHWLEENKRLLIQINKMKGEKEEYTSSQQPTIKKQVQEVQNPVTTVINATKNKTKDQLFDEGNQHRKQHRYNQAVECYHKVVQIDPSHALAYYHLGYALRQLNKKEEAVASYNKAIGIDPMCAMAYNNKGLALDDLNMKEEAVASYKKAIDINPKYALAHHNMGSALSDLGKFHEAVSSYHKAIQLDHNVKNTYQSLKRLLLNKLKSAAKIAESVKFLETIIAQHPDNHRATSITAILKTELLKYP